MRNERRTEIRDEERTQLRGSRSEPSRSALAHPVQQLVLHTGHWIEVAAARFPELVPQMDELSERLAEAVGETATEDGVFMGTESPGEIVVAVEKILAIMREVAPFLARSH